MVRLTAAPALAVDLGTANTLVYELGKGIVLNEPSVAAVREDSREVIAVGSEAPATLGDGQTPIRLVRPLAAGIISDIDVAERMLAGFVERVAPPRRLGSRPHLVVAVPSSVTGVDRRAVADAVYAAGAGTVELVEEPIAAAIGAGLPVEEPTPSVIVDIGGGTTEVAMIADGGIVASVSVPVGGNALDQAIIGWIRKEHALLVGDRAAEQLKIAVGSAWPRRHETEADIRGRDLVSGLPGSVTVNGGDVRVAMDQPLAEILAAVRDMLDRCPPDLTAELDTRGLLITGGGALLSGLAERLGDATGLPVTVADRPLECVVLGAATYLR
jgi:rod shape-determining protein MreB and related proteins